MRACRRPANLRRGIVPLFALAASATGLQAQGPWDEESPLADAVQEVLDLYHQLAADQAEPGEKVQLPGAGQWGLVADPFQEGGSRVTEFDVTAGSYYRIVGVGEATATDLGLCIYDNAGREVRCDRISDAVPLRSFTAESSGTYRAVPVAKTLNRPAHAGLVIVKESTEVGTK